MRKDRIQSSKVRQVMEYLQNVLLPLPCGGRLPGIRAIMARTGMGRRTVAHALQNLADDGMLRVDFKRGIFRIKPDEQPDEIRLLHWTIGSLNKSEFNSLLCDTLQQLAAADGQRIIIENATRHSKEEIAAELIGHGISRCIVFGAQISDFAELLARKMKICMELLPRHMDSIVPELRESPDMTVMQLHYLSQRGYRRIGYVHQCSRDASLYPVQVLRLLDYYRLMAEHHLYVNPDWVFHAEFGFNLQQIKSGIRRILTAEPAPDALIVPDIRLLRILQTCCREAGLRIGRDLAVICNDDLGGKFDPEPTAVTNNPVDIAQTFWRMFQAAERGEKVESAYTELFIRTGQTVPRRVCRR